MRKMLSVTHREGTVGVMEDFKAGYHKTPMAVQQPLLISQPRLARSEPKGVVYTKQWVVELLLDLAEYTSNVNLVDAVAIEPAAGSGAFVGPMIERLIASCHRQGRPLSHCRDSLIAYELDEKSAKSSHLLARNILSKHGLSDFMAESLASAWIRKGDYLFEAPIGEANWVIGNPPYIRSEEIPENTASIYRETYRTMRGRADLYIAFFEAALGQLKSNGTCAFICADRWMRNQYGTQLRELVTSGFSVDAVIEMHNANAFHDEVDAYPAITIIRRRRQETAIVASIGTEVENLSSKKLSSTLRNAYIGKPSTLKGLRVALINNWFKGSVPWPCHSPKQLSLLRHLEDKFPLLEAFGKVGIGVATGYDKAFITDDNELVESSRLLKLALAGDIWNGTMKWSGHYLVNPWDEQGLVNLNNYPRLKAHFEWHASALKSRHTAIKNAQGWHKTIDRVTHSLTFKPKLYIADIKNKLDPVLDRGETYPHHNLYYIQSDKWNLEVLGGLLMSEIGHFFVESYGVRMRGGYFRFQAQYLRRIRVPSPQDISNTQSIKLVEAFRQRDRQVATQIALKIYKIDKNEMEDALGY